MTKNKKLHASFSANCTSEDSFLFFETIAEGIDPEFYTGTPFVKHIFGTQGGGKTIGPDSTLQKHHGQAAQFEEFSHAGNRVYGFTPPDTGTPKIGYASFTMLSIEYPMDHSELFQGTDTRDRIQSFIDKKFSDGGIVYVLSLNKYNWRSANINIGMHGQSFDWLSTLTDKQRQGYTRIFDVETADPRLISSDRFNAALKKLKTCFRVIDPAPASASADKLDMGF